MNTEEKENNLKLIYDKKIEFEYDHKQMTSSSASRIFPERLDLFIDDYFGIDPSMFISFIRVDITLNLERKSYSMGYLLDGKKINTRFNLAYIKHWYTTVSRLDPVVPLGFGIVNEYELNLNTSTGLNTGIGIYYHPNNQYIIDIQFNQYIPLSAEYKEEPTKPKEEGFIYGGGHLLFKLIKKM